MAGGASTPIRVLYVDDEPDIPDLAATFLERERTDIEVLTADSGGSALERLESDDAVDCIVSDYDMADLDGLTLLRRVRETHPDLPFLLMTGKGSEEIASEAISAGVSDYLQKGTGTDQYPVLANRIANIVHQTRAEHQFRSLAETSLDVIFRLDDEGCFTYLSPAVERMLGFTPAELEGEHFTAVMTESDAERARAAFERILEGSTVEDFEIRVPTADGEERILSANIVPATDTTDAGAQGVARDITDQRQREAELRRQNERLAEFASVVSHDLKNPLHVSKGFLDIALEDVEAGTDLHDDLSKSREALDRMERLIDDLLTLARQGETVGETEPVELAAVVEQAWENLDTRAASLSVAGELPVLDADPDRLVDLLANLFRNAITHGGDDVAVTVGPRSDGGYYVADDGPGIDPDERQQVFESGYSTAEEGTGFGLPIVRQIVRAHGWSITVAESDAGGARFEIQMG